MQKRESYSALQSSKAVKLGKYKSKIHVCEIFSSSVNILCNRNSHKQKSLGK